MTPKSERPKTKAFSMRMDPDLHDQLQKVVGESKGGSAGGMSLLFHQLGYLYLGQEVPLQRWRVDLATDLLDEHEWAIEEVENMVSRGEKVPHDLLERLFLHKQGLLYVVSRLPAPGYERLRALTLIGRLEIVLPKCNV